MAGRHSCTNFRQMQEIGTEDTTRERQRAGTVQISLCRGTEEQGVQTGRATDSVTGVLRPTEPGPAGRAGYTPRAVWR